MVISKTQIDKLGERLKQGAHTEADLRLLDEYRRSFGDACEVVVRKVRELGEAPTARLAKSTLSIAEKLRRESIRLSQMQDVAGCRVVVADIIRQDRFVESLKSAFPDASIVDRRENPSYAYRAVHVIAEVSGKPVEIQVRSSLQHLWAELSEKSSDVIDPTIKYGGGPDGWRAFLIEHSRAVASYEKCERVHFEAMANAEEAIATNENLTRLVTQLLALDLDDHEAQERQEQLEALGREAERLKRWREELNDELVHMWNERNRSLQAAFSRLDDQERWKQ